MSRIVYLAFPTGAIAGGIKIIARHVEALVEMGFDAVMWVRDDVPLWWFEHSAPVEVATPFRADDILVLPQDVKNAIRRWANGPHRTLVFCQGHISFASSGGLDAVCEAVTAPEFIAAGPTIARALQRLFPRAPVHTVPAFADERLFKPATEKVHAVLHAPWKRPYEAVAIRSLLKRLHPRHARTPWARIENATEAQAAEAFARYTVFLSLGRLEGLGMTPLEAMASGAVVAGLTAQGGKDFATPDNGFWIDDEDPYAAADRLAEALDLVLTGGPPLRRYQDAAQDTARQWSYARFRAALETTWTHLAPDARALKPGPQP